MVSSPVYSEVGGGERIGCHPCGRITLESAILLH